MAQIKIRKFSPGGTLYTETGDAFTLEQVQQMLKEHPENENLKDIVDELSAGRDVSHSISKNWSSVTSDDFNKGQKRRIAKGPNSFARRLAATFDTQVHQYGEDVNDTTALLSAARNKTATNPTGAETVTSAAPSSSDYTLISSGGGARFSYDPETGGYIKDDFTNNKLMMLLNNLDAYLSNDDPEVKYKFKGLPADVRNVLKEMYAANPNMIKELMQKIQNGRIIDGSPEASLLLQLGIGSNMTREELAQSKKDKALKDYFVNQGFSEDQYKDFLPYVELDSQGLRWRTDVEGGPFMSGQNYYFNDDYNGPFKDILKGKILFNNRFYNADQLAQSGMISEWVDALKKHDFAKANSLIKWDWKGVSDNYDYQLFNDQKFHNDFLKGKRYLDVTGQYERDYDERGNEYQIVSYYDPSDSNVFTSLGFVDPSKIKYARLDSMGNVIDEDYNVAMLRKAATPWSHTTRFYQRKDNGQVITPTIVTQDGIGVLGMDVSRDPEKGTIQFSGGLVQDVLDDAGNAIELDGEIAQILSPEFFNNLKLANRDLLGKFTDTILSLVGNKFGNTYTRNELSLDEWVALMRPTYGADAEKYANIMYNYIAQYIGEHGFLGIIGGGLNRSAKLHQFARSYQQGGLFTGSATAASGAPKIVKSERYTPAITEEAGAFQFSEFTEADWLELAGLGADLTSVVTGLTGFSPASAISGVAGTLSTFGADITRDGFQMKDLGNLGLGLLFDAASLIPFAGSASSAAKTVKALKKALPILMKLAGAVGIGSAFSLAVNKIQSGEELTMKDLRIIMNGVLGTYTLAKQGVDVTNSRKKDGISIDADAAIRKAHMDQIDASNLSEGQKAAMRHFFDPDYKPTDLNVEQQRIYDQFISDGGDELALKMILGDNDTFKAIRKDLDLLERAKIALRDGTPMSKEDVVAYDDLLRRSNIARHKVEQPEFDELVASARAENTELRAALETLETNPTDANALSIVAARRADPKYKDFFEKWDAMPDRADLDKLDEIIATGTDDYRGGMFKRKNRYFLSGQDDEAAGAWAADVKQRERVADEILAGFDQTSVKRAEEAVNLARSKRSEIETQSQQASAAAQKKIDEAEIAKTAASQEVKAAESTGNAETIEIAKRKLSEAEAEVTRATEAKTQQERAFEAQLAAADAEIATARSARTKVQKGYRTWVETAKANGDLEFDTATGLYRKTRNLTQQVEDVRTQFEQVGLTRSQAQTERDAILASSSENAHRAEFAQKRAENVKNILDENLSGDGQIVGKFEDSSLWNGEYARLSPAEKTEVAQILNKKLSDLTPEEIAILNHYTAKAHGVNGDEIAGMWNARRSAAMSEEAVANFKLDESVGINSVNTLFRKANLPGKVKLTETEWARIRRADNQLEAFRQVLLGKGVSESNIKRIAGEIFVEPNTGARTWFRRKSDSTTTSSEPNFRIDTDKVTTDYVDDNSLKGRILGRTTKQRQYMDDLYGNNRAITNWRSAPYRYYQPMIHGLHYNLMRDPVHHTPWYEPKEITIQLENEED